MVEERPSSQRKPRKEMRNKATKTRRKSKRILRDVSLGDYSSEEELYESK